MDRLVNMTGVEHRLLVLPIMSTKKLRIGFNAFFA